MTNKEKTKEIGAKHGIGTNGFDSDIMNAIEEMAEWKDHQFKEYLEKELNEQKEKFKNEQILYDHYDWVTEGKIEQLNEIINELFKED